MKLKKLVYAFFILLIIGLFFLGYSYFESRWVRIKRITISSPDIPDSFNGKKIAFITDIHHGPFLSIKRVAELVKRVNKLQPDIVLMGGDYVHRDPKYIRPVFDELKLLTPKLGTYAVLGNHDHWEDAPLTTEMMLINGIHICDNKSYWIRIGNDSIKIGGVGDLWEDAQIIDSTVHDLKKTDFCILLSHNPDYLESLHSGLIDLSLCGHTHGGQMTLFGMWAPILPSEFGQKYRYGFVETGNMKSYISSGFGTITPPVRFFCRPEIVLITLKK